MYVVETLVDKAHGRAFDVTRDLPLTPEIASSDYVTTCHQYR